MQPAKRHIVLIASSGFLPKGGGGGGRMFVLIGISTNWRLHTPSGQSTSVRRSFELEKKIFFPPETENRIFGRTIRILFG